jgi:hypothetical protein
VWPKYSCGLAIVVFQEPTEPLSALDRPFTIIGRLPGTQRHHIAESLMTTFLMVMLDVLAQHMAQCAFPKQHHPRKHLTLRTRIKRLTRKTICFSKTTQMRDIVLGLFVNRYAFARAV